MYVCMYVCMLWCKCVVVLGANFIFLCLKLIIIHYHNPKTKGKTFAPRAKLQRPCLVILRISLETC